MCCFVVIFLVVVGFYEDWYYVELEWDVGFFSCLLNINGNWLIMFIEGDFEFCLVICDRINEGFFVFGDCFVGDLDCCFVGNVVC